MRSVTSPTPAPLATGQHSPMKTRTPLVDLYVDGLWNLHAGASVMLVELPRMAELVSHRDLATVLRDGLAQTSHRVERLEAMLIHFEGPARVHAEEVEALIGHGARYVAGWPSGDVRDIAVGTVARVAWHYAMPEYQVTAALAESIGYKQDAIDLRTMLANVRLMDETLHRIIEGRIAAGAPRA
jgi:ferritin-like metal-binding protein YciE